MIQPTSPSLGSLSWFCRRFFLILFNPVNEWRRAALEEISEGGLFKGYCVPLSLISPLLMAPFVLLPGFYLGRTMGLLSCIFIFGINLTLTRLYALIFEAMAIGFGGSCSRISSLKLSSYSLTPWIVSLGLFPFIRELSMLGLLWAFILFVIGTKQLVTIEINNRWKFIALSAFLCLLLLFLSNLFFAGVLGIIAGPGPIDPNVAG